MEISVLLVGFMIGLRHALEADHVAAVASIVTQKQGKSAALRHGAVWGLGHTLTLFAFGTAALLADTLNAVQNFWLGMGYMMLFGIGSMAGMAVLSVAISLPFNFPSKHIEGFAGYLQLGIGVGTSGFGGFTVFNYFY